MNDAEDVATVIADAFAACDPSAFSRYFRHMQRHYFVLCQKKDDMP